MSLLRAKKFLASRMGETKLGRAAIVRFIGPEGDRLMRTLKAAAIKYTDEDVARQLRKDILKLASKCGLLYRDHILTEETVRPAVPAVTAAIDKLVEILDLPTVRLSEADVHDLAARLKALDEALTPILGSLMKVGNAMKLSGILEFYGEERFLSALLRERDFAEEKRALLISIRNLARPFESFIRVTQVCVVPGCLLARAGIRGSGYCEPHHFERFRDKLETPKLLEFMQNTEYLKHFRAAIEGRPNLMSLLQFWLAVEDFKTISNRSLLPQRADGIMSRFFSESAEGGSLLGTELAEEKVAAARALLLDRARAGVFAALQADAFEKLDAVFHADFVGSTHFKAYARDIGMEGFLDAEGKVRPREAAMPVAPGTYYDMQLGAELQVLQGAMTLPTPMSPSVDERSPSHGGVAESKD